MSTLSGKTCGIAQDNLELGCRSPTIRCAVFCIRLIEFDRFAIIVMYYWTDWLL